MNSRVKQTWSTLYDDCWRGRLRNGGTRGGERDVWAGSTLWWAGRGGRLGWPTLRDTGMGWLMCKGW